MRELKNSELEAVSGGIMVRRPTLEDLIFKVVFSIALRHFGIELPMQQRK